jgi:predicted PurR-regulated permease PerM
LSILFIFIALGIVFTLIGIWGVQKALNQWDSFKESAPIEFTAALGKMRVYESHLKNRYPLLQSIHPTDTLLKSGTETGQWFIDHGASLMGAFLTWIFLIPAFTFVLLNEGRSIRKGLFQLVPNRMFETFFLITTHITTAISDYLRAKLLEALLVGLLVMIGLAMLRNPYAIVLGILAGITNIIPYAGPIIGALPGILLAAFNPESSSSTLSVTMVYLVANVIDTVLIFPLVVANLVDLHPLILIAVVAVGQNYYGLIGMLIAIPIATALKVVLGVIYQTVYEQRSLRTEPYAPSDSDSDA